MIPANSRYLELTFLSILCPVLTLGCHPGFLIWLPNLAQLLVEFCEGCLGVIWTAGQCLGADRKTDQKCMRVQVHHQAAGCRVEGAGGCGPEPPLRAQTGLRRNLERVWRAHGLGCLCDRIGCNVEPLLLFYLPGISVCISIHSVGQ